MVSSDSNTYSKKLLLLISWGHWFTFFNIIAAIVLSSFYLFSESMPETLLGQLYLFSTWISHMGFLTFMSFVLILFPLILLFPNTKFIRTSASIIFTIELLLLVLDAYIYSRLGYHLNASSSEQIISLIVTQINKDPALFWFVSTILCLMILAYELVISNYAWKHLRQLQKTQFAPYVIFSYVVLFFFSHSTHIWADAKLDYDVLRQDTVLPLSYPSTAKTLLTKYGLFNLDDYIERRTSSLSFNDTVPTYPQLPQQCSADISNQQSTFVILTKELLDSAQIKQFSQRSHSANIRLNYHIDTAQREDGWFNLLYSLPSIYQQGILQQQTMPLLFQAIEAKKLAKTLTVIGNKNTDIDNSELWYENLFDSKTQLTDISSLVFADKLNSVKQGLHFIYFTDNNSYQFELFMDALLLAQQQKSQRDIIWVSSIGNTNTDTSLSIKPALLIWPSEKSSAKNTLTSHMDLQPTLVESWLGCNLSSSTYSSGDNLLKLRKDRIIANTMKDGIMVFNKDKSVFIDQNGNFQSYSRQLEAPITVSADFPLMIDGVHFIKQFSLSNKVNP
ncbi:DUF3413 domain-containing protein [Colwelliaceae bacterium 6471]